MRPILAMLAVLVATSVAQAETDPRDVPPPGQVTPPGCFTSFSDENLCWEPESVALWPNRGKEGNLWTYGKAVGQLLNRYIDDRSLLWEWVHEAERQRRKNRALRARCGNRCRGL